MIEVGYHRSTDISSPETRDRCAGSLLKITDGVKCEQYDKKVVEGVKFGVAECESGLKTSHFSIPAPSESRVISCNIVSPTFTGTGSHILLLNAP
jgi:hypothetical protein